MEETSIEKALAGFKPESIVFVVSYDKKNKRPSGMIAGWSMQCSSNPYMFAIALWKKGYTHKLIQQTKEFVIAIPNKKIEKAIEIFGTTHGDKVDKFELTKLKTLSAKHIRPPLLADATTNLECRVEQEIDPGDHIIFIGRVLAAYADEKGKVLLNMGKVNGKRVFQEF